MLRVQRNARSLQLARLLRTRAVFDFACRRSLRRLLEKKSHPGGASKFGAVFWGLNKAGKLRIPVEEEEAGLDVSHHGGKAYEFELSEKTEAATTEV